MKEYESLLRSLRSIPGYATMTPEEVAIRIGEIMRIEQIESEYGTKIKQGPNGRWWIRIDGHLYSRNTRESLIKGLLKLHKPNVPTLDGIAGDWLTSRLISRSAGPTGETSRTMSAL